MDYELKKALACAMMAIALLPAAAQPKYSGTLSAERKTEGDSLDARREEKQYVDARHEAVDRERHPGGFDFSVSSLFEDGKSFSTSYYDEAGRETFQQGGFEYSVIIVPPDKRVATISDADMNIPLPVTEDSTLVIPSSVTLDGKEYKVDCMKRGAFCGRSEIKHLIISEGIENLSGDSFLFCENLVSVWLPSTLRFLDNPNPFSEQVFEGCTNLRQITVDEKNKTYDSREGCNAIIHTEKNELVSGCLGTVIPASVKTIGNSAFGGCLKMEHITIPEGVSKIEVCAFSGCAKLKTIDLPKSLNEICTAAFRECSSLESIRIPKNVTKIGKGLFDGCYNLRNIEVDPQNRTFDSRKHCNAIVHTESDTIVAGCGTTIILKGIKGIGEWSLRNTALRSIHIPASVEHIGEMAFAECRLCNSITVHPHNRVYTSPDHCNAIIETATGRLIQGCGTTTIPQGTTEIGKYAFASMSMPCHLFIPEGVRVIGKNAFRHCDDIKQLYLPSTLTRIREDAFWGNSRLYYVDISKSTTFIESGAFARCPSLCMVEFTENHVDISPTTFFESQNEEWLIKKFGLPVLHH